MSKKYYWLKLQDNFFDREEIKIVENMPNGKEYIIFYMKLLLKSIKTEGKLKFREIIPYTPEMLSHVTGTNIDTVINAIDLFSRLQLMEKWDDGTLFMAETKNMIGSESKWAEIKRKQRESKKELNPPLDNVPSLSAECPIEIELDKEIEIELDKEIDIELDKDSNISKDILSSTKVQLIIENWNSLGLQKVVSIKQGTNRYKLLNARIKEYGLDTVLKAIDNINKSPFLKGQNNRGWIITFDWFIKPNNFIKVLEENYLERKVINEEKNIKTVIHKKEDKFNNYEQRDYSKKDLDDLEKKLLGWS